MDIKKYEVLLNTIDRGSFVKTCEELGYTQSGITHMMNSMEKEIGFALLRRSNKGVRLTPEGQQVLPTIRELVKLNERLNQQFDLIKGMETGKVRIGSFSTIAGAWLPEVIQNFEMQYPNIQIELVEENSMWKLEEWLSEGRIDLCFISRQPYHTFDWIDLKMDPFLAVLPIEHPLAKNDRVPAAAFASESFLMCRCLDGPDRDISRYFEKVHVAVQSKFSSNSDFTILFMVERGLGVSILPELILKKMLHVCGGKVVTRPLQPMVYRSLGVGIRSVSEISPAMERFIKCTKEVLLEK